MNRPTKDYTYFIIYKTTNLINNRFYIGFHCCSQLDDDYLGSGTAINRAIKKYGEENFKREILIMCSSFEELVLKEESIVNIELLKDPLCYNLTIGGKGGFYYINNGKNKKEIRNRATESLRKTHENNPEIRQRIGKKVSEYAKNNPDKIKESNAKAQESRNLIKDLIKENQSIALKKFYESDAGILKKQKNSEQSKEFFQSEKGIEQRKQMSIDNLGFNNPEFQKLCKDKYENCMFKVISFSYQCNLPDAFIMEQLDLTRKVYYNMLDYYEYLGVIKNVKKVNIKENFFNVITTKTNFEIVDKSFKDLKKHDYKILNETFILKFNDCLFYILNEYYSDSYISNTLNIQNIERILNYMVYLNLISILKVEKMDIRKSFPNAQRKTGTKTFIKFNENFEQNYFLIKKGDQYGKYSINISENENGKSISISRN